MQTQLMMEYRSNQYLYGDRMLAAIKFALKYSAVVPDLIEFISICAVSSEGGYSKRERLLLMKKYWDLVKVIQANS